MTTTNDETIPAATTREERGLAIAALCKIDRKGGVSKTDVAMKNEVLCKILAHNICCLISAMYELNLRPVFEKMLGCTKNVTAAQECLSK